MAAAVDTLGSMKHFLPAVMLAAVTAMPLVATTVAWAQPPAADAPAAPSPPTPGKPDEPPVVMNYFVMLVILGAVIGASLIPSKRGHQD